MHATVHVTLHGCVTCIALDRIAGKSCTRIVDDTTSYTTARRSWDGGSHFCDLVITRSGFKPSCRTTETRGCRARNAASSSSLRCWCTWNRASLPDRGRRTRTVRAANRARTCMWECTRTRFCVMRAYACICTYVRCMHVAPLWRSKVKRDVRQRTWNWLCVTASRISNAHQKHLSSNKRKHSIKNACCDVNCLECSNRMLAKHHVTLLRHVDLKWLISRDGLLVLTVNSDG